MTLAFVAGLQHLPPQQRAVLVLRDVLGFHAAEVAEMLDTSDTSVNSLLRRARAALEIRLPAAGAARAATELPREREVAGRFADAMEAVTSTAMVSLLTDDALLTMPPQPLEYQGHEAIGGFLSYREDAAARRCGSCRPGRIASRPSPATSRCRAGIARPRGCSC